MCRCLSLGSWLLAGGVGIILDASKREIEAISENTYLVLHPDKDGCSQWLLNNHITVDMVTYNEGKAKVADFFQVWEKHQGHAL